MEILDGKRHDGAAKRLQAEWIVSLLNGGKHWGWLDHSADPKMFTPEQVRRGDRAFIKALRALVNQWIDSGKDPNGVEEPLTRDVNKIPPGYTQPLFEVLLAWLNRNTPKPALMRSGKVAIVMQSPIVWELDENGRVKYLEPERYAEECAVFHLKELLDLSGAHRVAHCNNPECGRYYLRGRLFKKPIKRGTYCGRCEGAGSVERTRASREARRRKLVNLAGDFWDSWKPTHRHGRKPDWVAKQMNKRSGSAITGRWVSRNLRAIETEVERRQHAKS